MVTVDGFFAGPNGEINWHHVDAEFNKDSLAFLDDVDTLMFGRVTYELMASYWPTEEALKDDTAIAQKMNSLPKLVFSTQPEVPEWNNTTLLHTINADEISKLKHSPGKDIAIFGSGTIVSTLTELGLIDEYIFVVNPVVLGRGKSLFSGATHNKDLTLVGTKQFTSGNIALSYVPA